MHSWISDIDFQITSYEISSYISIILPIELIIYFAYAYPIKSLQNENFILNVVGAIYYDCVTVWLSFFFYKLTYLITYVLFVFIYDIIQCTACLRYTLNGFTNAILTVKVITFNRKLNM